MAATQSDGHGEVALAALGEAVAGVDEEKEGGGEEGGQRRAGGRATAKMLLKVGGLDRRNVGGESGRVIADREECGGAGEAEGEVEEAPGQGTGAEEVHGGEFDEEGARHVHVAEVAVGGPAAFDQEGDVVDQGGVADQGPVDGEAAPSSAEAARLAQRAARKSESPDEIVRVPRLSASGPVAPASVVRRGITLSWWGGWVRGS